MSPTSMTLIRFLTRILVSEALRASKAKQKSVEANRLALIELEKRSSRLQTETSALAGLANMVGVAAGRVAKPQ